MPITINGSGTLTGISAGGLPDDSIIAADIAAGAVTTAKVADANITAAKLDGAQSGSAPIYGCRAWVNFDGTSGSIGSGRANGNVSSITDNGTGDYTVNFTTAMPDANYAVTGLCVGTDSSAYSTIAGSTTSGSITTASVRFCVRNMGSPATLQDFAFVSVAVFR